MGRQKKFIIISDVHGIERDDKVCKAMLKFVKDFNPDIRVIAGDLFDFGALRKGVTQEDSDSKQDLDEDIAKGLQIAKAFYKGGTENVFLEGNHEHRIYNFLSSPNQIKRRFGLEVINYIHGSMEKMGVDTILPYHAKKGVYELGLLKVVHGYFHGANAAKQHAQTYGTCVFGHTHRVDSCKLPTQKGHIAFNIGCLCKKDMSYMNINPNMVFSREHGFAYGVVDSVTGYFKLEQAIGIENTFRVATNFKTYKY